MRCQKGGVVPVAADLKNQDDDEGRECNRQSHIVAEVQRHRDEVARRFPERRRKYLEDPENRGDFRDLTDGLR